MERIVTSKVNAISKQVYDEIQNDNLFALSSEPNNVREYINEVLMEMWGGDRDLLRQGKDKRSNQGQK